MPVSLVTDEHRTGSQGVKESGSTATAISSGLPCYCQLMEVECPYRGSCTGVVKLRGNLVGKAWRAAHTKLRPLSQCCIKVPKVATHPFLPSCAYLFLKDTPFNLQISGLNYLANWERKERRGKRKKKMLKSCLLRGHHLPIISSSSPEIAKTRVANAAAL